MFARLSFTTSFILVGNSRRSKVRTNDATTVFGERTLAHHLPITEPSVLCLSFYSPQPSLCPSRFLCLFRFSISFSLFRRNYRTKANLFHWMRKLERGPLLLHLLLRTTATHPPLSLVPFSSTPPLVPTTTLRLQPFVILPPCSSFPNPLRLPLKSL